MTFLPAAGVTMEEQGCPKGPGTPSSCCGGAMGSVPKGQGEQEGILKCRSGRAGVDVMSVGWVSSGTKECLTLVLSHYVVRGHFPFPSSQLACSLLLMINEFPLSSCSSPGNRQWVEEGSGQELASLMSSASICPLSCPTGLTGTKHLPPCHFQFWLTHIYPKSLQMPQKQQLPA